LHVARLLPSPPHVTEAAFATAVHAEQVSETEMPLLSTVKNPAPQTARLLPLAEQVTEAASVTAEQVSTVPSSR